MKTGMGIERRKHRRFPVVEGLVAPLEVAWTAGKDDGDHKQPAVLTNLSAGGMSLVTFIEPPHTKRIMLHFSLPGFSRFAVEARILRVHTKGQVHTLGLEFVKIDKRTQSKINHMAEDYNDCETRIALALPEACVPSCCCHQFCSKAQKAPHWPPQV